jgi:ATP-dependent DNA helicase RecG
MGHLPTVEFVFDAAHLPLFTPDEIYRHCDGALLQKLSEDRRIERKSCRIERRAVGDYLSMWANTKPSGGLLAIGIENDGSITGCQSLSVEERNGLDKAAYDYCPDCRSDSRLVAVVNTEGGDDFILLIRVYYREDRVVRTTAGKAFVRIGDAKHELSEEEIRELQIDKHELDLEREPVVDLIWPDEFHADLVKAFCGSVRDKWGLTSDQTNEQILTHRRLGKIIGGAFVPNTACLLAFANDPLEKFPGCKVRFLRFDGEMEKTGERYNVVKDIATEGPIPLLIEHTAEIIESQLRDFSALGKDGKFYSVPEYPRSAWYEALVNACVHRSYGLKTRPVFVKMFDDRLVIESPGGFPPTVTPDNIYENHHPRNPTTMDALKYLDFVKCHNEGTRRMRETMAESKLPLPEFEQKGTAGGAFGVRVTLRNNVKFRKALVDSTVHASIDESKLRNLDDRERMVLNFIAENGRINVSQCQRQLTMSRWHTAKTLLTAMTRKGLLKHRKPSGVDRSRSFFTLARRK